MLVLFLILCTFTVLWGLLRVQWNLSRGSHAQAEKMTERWLFRPSMIDLKKRSFTGSAPEKKSDYILEKKETRFFYNF